MVGRTDYSSVPTAVDLENNTNQKKYTVNRKPGGLVISKPLCTLMAIGALLLAVLVGLLVFFLVPRCEGETTPQSLTNRNNDISNDELITKPLSYNGVDDEVDERLPRSLQPTLYRIQIMPFLDNQTFNGAITITLNVNEETRDIIFHAKGVDIDQSSVRVKSAKSSTPLSITSQDYIEGDKYRIVLDESLSRNIMYTVELMYLGHLNHQLQGFYRSQYEDFVGGYYHNQFLASTQFSPTDARRAFPCFDEPSFKANFSIHIARTSNLTSISNMKIEKSDPDVGNPGWTWDHYEVTPKMSTYLVAFVVGDLQAYGSSDKLIKVWSRRSLIHQTTYAADFAPKVLHFFENYFNIQFPLPKIDIVAIPDFGFQAMENWGLITFRESSLLFDSEESDVDNKRTVATVLAHELGHQWFGNLVTPKWWNDLWLKEGFATYLQYLGTDFAEPSWNIGEEFIIATTTGPFAQDALESSRPISFDVKNNKQIRQTFDELSYGKGACLIRMMNHFLGEKVFKTALINFLQKYQYANAAKDDLFATLTEEAHRSGVLDPSMSVKEIMDSWTTKAGYPVITAIADHANRKLILSQKRFLFTNKPGDNGTWWVPISITTDEKRDFKNTTPSIWLKNEPMMTVNMELRSWYLLNINQTGYYIVNYDESNWRLLSENIMQLPALIRAQLISDSMDLARANLLDYDIPLKMLGHMAIRDELIMFVPTTIAFKKLQFLRDMLHSTPAFGLFEEFQWTIFKKTYRRVEENVEYDDPDYLNQKIRRAVLDWACQRSDSACAITMHHMFRAWMQENKMVPPTLRAVAYCTTIRQGTEAEWNFAYNKYLSTTSVSEKNILLDALGCTTKKWLLSRYLDNLVQQNSSIRIQDADRVFKSVADNSMANSMAFDFLRTNWDKLQEHYGEGFNIVAKMVSSLPRYMNTEYQLSELIRFRNEVRNNIGTTGQAFDRAIEKVKGNVEWMEKNYHSIEAWLNNHKYNYNLL